MTSDCCDSKVIFECGENKELVGICVKCKEWCAVLEEKGFEHAEQND
jgi:hypothetical protein